MRKIKYFILSAALATMLVGAGYAAWTDDIKITDTVKTGQLDVYFDTEGAEFKNVSQYVTTDVKYQNQADDTNGQNKKDIAKVTLGNMYPGAKANVTLKIMNNSTIPVGMNAITDVRSENWGVNGDNFEQIGASLRFFDANGNPLKEFSADTTSYANPWAPTQLQGAELPVGGYATLTFMFTASDNIEEDDTYEFSPTAVFKQFNK